MGVPTIQEIREASDRINHYIHRTPVQTCSTIDVMCGAHLFFKCENLQKVGAFKIRGATNAVFTLTDQESEHGVATHSSGNHGAALALAAKWRGIKAYVIMPANAAEIKRRAVQEYGGVITLCQPTLRAREEGLSEVVARTGAVVVHPYNDYRVIAGQGTAALELCDEIRDLDMVIVPVGGGGLLSGTALCVSSVAPATRVVAAEPESANDAWQSLQAGHLIPLDHTDTIADGLRTSLGDKTYPIIQKHVSQIVTVSEDEIIGATRIIWERMKQVVEPSGAVPLAAVLSGRLSVKGLRIGIILSGGNVDLDNLLWMR